MGGPHIRTAQGEIEAFLRARPSLDYYVPGEGERPLTRLVRGLLAGERFPAPLGCATVRDADAPAGERRAAAFRFEAEPFSAGARDMDLPSPYLTGWLDPFLADPNMIPLLETNRGCPFGCTYCTWGDSALSRVKKRALDTVEAEIDYVAEHSAGQVTWIFCDANFGLLPRDLDIARMIRKVMDAKGFPIYVYLWHSKNTSQRNIEIAGIVGQTSKALVAIQSADDAVLAKAGRKNIKLSGMLEQVRYYHQRGVEVKTDILLGLPGETRQSHFNSLKAGFDMGFDFLEATNIRMLPGSVFETPAYRAEHGIKTKFRPIFGACGEYDGQRVFEVEEGVRATSAMTEEELNSFKVHHWLIYFGWNSGMFRPALRFGQVRGANPVEVIEHLAATARPELRALFDGLLAESMGEWFAEEDAFVAHYEAPEHFDSLRDFLKLNYAYIARMIQHPATVDVLLDELRRAVQEELAALGAHDEALAGEIFDLTGRLWCRDLLSGPFEEQRQYSGRAAAVMLDRPELAGRDTVTLRIRRSEEAVRFCRFQLAPEGAADLSLRNLARFLETGGLSVLMLRAELAE
jgi:putative methyltransferase